MGEDAVFGDQAGGRRGRLFGEDHIVADAKANGEIEICLGVVEYFGLNFGVAHSFAFIRVDLRQRKVRFGIAADFTANGMDGEGLLEILGDMRRFLGQPDAKGQTDGLSAVLFGE